jgi:hypothetical protein
MVAVDRSFRAGMLQTGAERHRQVHEAGGLSLLLRAASSHEGQVIVEP